MDCDLVHHIMGYTCNTWNIKGLFIYNNGKIMVCWWIYFEFKIAVDNTWKQQFEINLTLFLLSCFFVHKERFSRSLRGFRV